MTSFVLVHGAWGGSYSFREVRRQLFAAGHEALTPSLTGIGERSHLTGPHIDLDTHITDVVNMVRYEDLDDIVLLGFSYGGMVVTGCLDHIGDRVRHLVYLDAFVPADGQSALSLFGRTFPQPALDPGTSWLVPAIPRELDTPEQTLWANERRSFQPIGTLRQPVSLSRPVDDWPFTRTYIKATADPTEASDSGFWAAGAHARTSDAWSYHEIETSHLIPIRRPTELTAILTALV
ncbi:MAG: alpha/beta hydrolase [Actinomycetota bacterium]|nr:alpha/beta hydrolase [Actinomycetota bacterium]